MLQYFEELINDAKIWLNGVKSVDESKIEATQEQKAFLNEYIRGGKPHMRFVFSVYGGHTLSVEDAIVYAVAWNKNLDTLSLQDAKYIVKIIKQQEEQAARDEKVRNFKQRLKENGL